MDILSDTLRVVRLTGAVFFTAKLSSPWAIESPPPDGLAQLLRSKPDCIALFHMLVDGRCWITLEGHAPLQIETGDVVIFPHADSHVMSSELGAIPKPISSILPPLPSEGIPLIEDGGAGRAARFVCGYLHCDQRFNSLIGSLPTLLWVRVCHDAERVGLSEKAVAAPSVVSAESGDWLEMTLRYTIEEADGGRPSSSAMLARLTELLFVEVLRRYMQQLPAEHRGWLAGVRDPAVGCVLQLMHAHPEQSWTVEDLARAAAISRSTLAQRFTELIGEPRMQYLSGWRIQVAKHLLRQTNLSMVEVADRVGYDSEAAFNRAFKRYVGQPPATWRRTGV